MEEKREGIQKKIYDICFFMYHFSKIDVQFIHREEVLSIQLYYEAIPAFMKQSRKQTETYVYEFLESQAPNCYFYYTDTFQLNYIGVGLWDRGIYQGAFLMGPFLAVVPNDIFMQDMVHVNHILHQDKEEMLHYYNMISTIDPNLSKKIGNLVVNLAMSQFQEVEAIYSKEHSKIKEEVHYVSENTHSYSEVEARFEIERKIMEHVSKGREKEALEVLGTFFFDASYRMPKNVLRVSKNLAFTFNTMLRIAIREGGVHPVYLHRISDKFAILIEKATSTKELEQLQVLMIKEYCKVVREVSTEGYHGIVKQAIEYINLNFSKELSLPFIADIINVSPSHLSKKFKKETGFTVTEFINKKRIQEAKRLLQISEHSITDIAILIGFEDPGYFTSVFRKLVGITPREYMKVYKKKD